MRYTAIDLFAGLGGFSLAAAANSVEVIAQVEIDELCRAFLKHHWGDIQHGDIRTFDGTKYRGQCWLLMGGPPCQPASRAGKQRGKADDRWLWPEAIRVLREVQPTWCLYENPLGIGDMDFAGILTDMENEGYETRVFSIPACAVNAPHRRERYWIVAYSEHSDQPDSVPGRACGRDGTCFEPAKGGEDDVADTETTTRLCLSHGQEHGTPASDGRCSTDFWRDYVWVPCADGKLRRAPLGIVGVADGDTDTVLAELAQTHRSALAALGNAITWPVAAQIIAAMCGRRGEA